MSNPINSIKRKKSLHRIQLAQLVSILDIFVQKEWKLCFVGDFASRKEQREIRPIWGNKWLIRTKIESVKKPKNQPKKPTT